MTTEQIQEMKAKHSAVAKNEAVNEQIKLARCEIVLLDNAESKLDGKFENAIENCRKHLANAEQLWKEL